MKASFCLGIKIKKNGNWGSRTFICDENIIYAFKLALHIVILVRCTFTFVTAVAYENILFRFYVGIIGLLMLRFFLSFWSWKSELLLLLTNTDAQFTNFLRHQTISLAVV